MSKTSSASTFSGSSSAAAASTAILPSSAPSSLTLSLRDFDYTLPAELIAQQPLVQRSASRLLVVNAGDVDDADQADQGGLLKDGLIHELAGLLQPGDLLVMNDTRVLHARLHGCKESGGRIEVLVERVIGEHEVLAQIRASKAPKAGSLLQLEEALSVKVLAREGEFYRLAFPATENVVSLLERHGHLPLPPYIARTAAQNDETRYQTVFARHHGSVAAPTAGLHFDDALLAAIEARGCALAYVTLHVGAGTFQPVRTENLAEHQMHRECYSLPQATVDAIARTRRQGGRVVAVGTTTLRTLEAAALAGGGTLQAGTGETELFILPGFEFRVVDVLLTNFHLPKSTLLMLVSAFAGMERMRQAYAHAIAQGYRFFSYGDAMLLTRSR